MRSRLLMLAAIVLLGACNILSDTTAPTGSATIYIFNNFFYPATDAITANEGDTITVIFGWTPGTTDHNVTWVDGPASLPAGSNTQNIGTYQATLVPGTYHYQCTLHAVSDLMLGTITVNPHAPS